jgi:hypothetical protein
VHAERNREKQCTSHFGRLCLDEGTLEQWRAVFTRADWIQAIARAFVSSSQIHPNKYFACVPIPDLKRFCCAGGCPRRCHNEQSHHISSVCSCQVRTHVYRQRHGLTLEVFVCCSLAPEKVCSELIHYRILQKPISAEGMLTWSLVVTHAISLSHEFCAMDR